MTATCLSLSLQQRFLWQDLLQKPRASRTPMISRALEEIVKIDNLRLLNASWFLYSDTKYIIFFFFAVPKYFSGTIKFLLYQNQNGLRLITLKREKKSDGFLLISLFVTKVIYHSTFFSESEKCNSNN